MQRRTTSFGLCVIGAGLIAHGNGVEGALFAGAGFFGLWHSGETFTCVDHMLASIRSKAEKKFSLAE